MAVTLCSQSALEWIRAMPRQLRALPRNDRPVMLHEIDTNYRQLRRMDLRSHGVSHKPVHVLAAGGAETSNASQVRTHRCGLAQLPAGSLIHAGDGLLVCSPELCFAQMARDLSPVGAVVLGLELCGSYAHFSPMVSGFYDRPPAASVESIRTLLGELRGMYGISHATRALRWVLDGSASPMETICSCMLFLPAELGGYGLVPPVLNHVVQLDEAASRMAGTRSCRIDAAWPNLLVGVEDDSLQHHGDPVRDLRRREALTHMGFSMYSIRSDQMTSIARFDETVALLGDRVPRQSGGHAPRARQQELLDRLLRATRYGVGIEAALFPVPQNLSWDALHL